MIEFIGWLGSMLFAFCGAPQAYQSWKEGHSDGIAPLFILMWGLGEVLTLTYVMLKHGWDLPLITNYVINILFIAVIAGYKLFPRRENENN